MNSSFNLLLQSAETGCGSKKERTFGQSHNSSVVDIHDKHSYDIWTDPSKPKEEHSLSAIAQTHMSFSLMGKTPFFDL